MKKFLLVFTIIIVAGWSTYALQPHYSQTPAMEAWMLNVGQGESVLVREPSGKKLLFDGGPDDSVLNELGAVLPVWDKTIDLVILSHPHSDHIRGLISVLQRYHVHEVWTSGATYDSGDYKAWISELNQEHLSPQVKFAPFTTNFGSITLQAFHPLHTMEGQQPSQAHDATLSIKASYGTEDIFLTGDLNEEHEQEMVTACQPPSCSLEAEVLQVPHHGSATGLTPAFLQAVHPKYALIPVGLNNKFKHPRPAILKELQENSIPIFRTDLNGRIHVVCTGTQVSVTTSMSQ